MPDLEAEMESTLFPSAGRPGRVGRFVVTKEETEVSMEFPSGLMTCQRGLNGDEEVLRALIDTSHHGPFPLGLLGETPQRNPIELSWLTPHTTPPVVMEMETNFGVLTSVHRFPLSTLGVIPVRQKTLPDDVIAQTMLWQQVMKVNPDEPCVTSSQTFPSGVDSPTSLRKRTFPSVLMAQTAFSSTASCLIR